MRFGVTPRLVMGLLVGAALHTSAASTFANETEPAPTAPEPAPPIGDTRPGPLETPPSQGVPPAGAVSEAVPAELTPPETAPVSPRPAPAPAAAAWNAEGLARLARAVVKIRSGKVWGSGFTFGSPRHVIASHGHVIASSDLEVIASDNVARRARAVAWSQQDDLVLLELDQDVPATPLEAADRPPGLGASIAVLYHPEEPAAQPSQAQGWSVPVVLFGHVGRVLKEEIDLDLGLWGRAGDAGAPIVDADGRVVAVVSWKSIRKRRMVATRAERARTLFRTRGRNGELSRPNELSWFAGVFFTPKATNRLVGMGVNLGFAYDWFALELSEGLFESGYTPTGLGRFEATSRLQLELSAVAQLNLGLGLRLLLGPGIQLNLDSLDIVEDVTSAGIHPREERRARVRGAGVLGILGGNLLARAVISKEHRFDIGFIFNR